MKINSVWLSAASCDLDSFKADGDAARRLSADPGTRPALLAEWARILMDGPGIVAFTRAYPDTAPIDAATKLFSQIIAEQHAAGQKPSPRRWICMVTRGRRDHRAFAAF